MTVACANHCISRVVGQEKLFTDAIKEKIQEIIINAAHLHGIHLINWTILSNHIHILAVVPGSDLKVPLSKSSLLKAVKALYSESYLTDLKQQFKRAEKLDTAEGQQAVQRILERYETNRGNLSEFMKEVKQRTSLYVNKRLKRYGTLWDNPPAVALAKEGAIQEPHRRKHRRGHSGCFHLHRSEFNSSGYHRSPGKLSLVRLRSSSGRQPGREKRFGQHLRHLLLVHHIAKSKPGSHLE